MKRIIGILFILLLGILCNSVKATSFSLIHSSYQITGYLTYLPWTGTEWGPAHYITLQVNSFSPINDGQFYLDCSISGEASRNRIFAEIDSQPSNEGHWAIAGMHIETTLIFRPLSMNPSTPITFFSQNDGRAPARASIKDLSSNEQLFSAEFSSNNNYEFYYSMWEPAHEYQLTMGWSFEDCLVNSTAQLSHDIIFVPENLSLVYMMVPLLILFKARRKWV